MAAVAVVVFLNGVNVMNVSGAMTSSESVDLAAGVDIDFVVAVVLKEEQLDMVTVPFYYDFVYN